MRVFLRQHLQVIAYLALALAVVYVAYRGESIARSNKGVLCDLKADIELRRDTTLAFVEAIEAGRRPPIPGISLTDLRVGLDNHNRTLAALSDLNC